MKEIEMNLSTVYYKIKLVKILDKYPKLKRSSLGLNFF